MRNHKKRRFAFLIHPRGITDVGRRLGGMLGVGEDFGMKIMSAVPENWALATLKSLKGRARFTICSKFQISDEVEGYLVAILMTAQQMADYPQEANQRIGDAVVYLQDHLGVSRVGLGAYTAPITLEGRKLVRDKRITAKITHGDSLTAVSAVEAICRIAETKNINITQAKVGIVGAYGLVGRGATLLVTELEPAGLILTGPKERKLKDLERELQNHGYYNTHISTNNSAISGADIVILTTTGAGDIVDRDMLKRDAIVIDMSQPHNMSRKVCEEREDVIRIDGGFMSIPGINLGFDMGPPLETTFACFLETMVCTMVNDQNNHVGKVDPEFAKHIWEKARELGFQMAPFTNFSEPLDLKSIKDQKPILKKVRTMPPLSVPATGQMAIQ